MRHEDITHDQLALFRIEGMHCHKCEIDIRRAMQQFRGVREVEVDYASGQVSVLFERETATIDQLTESITQAGYHVIEVNQAQPHAHG